MTQSHEVTEAEVEAAATAIALHAGGISGCNLPLGTAVLDVLSEPIRRDVMEKARAALEAAARLRVPSEGK